MCGIFGFVDKGARDTVDLSALAHRMRRALAHRGPDGWGFVTLEADAAEVHADAPASVRRRRPASHGPRALLGHHRLAVIDLTDGGRQPRSTPDGRFWITYNGEIYNYRDLRRELEDAGVCCESQSDTEVVLALFLREGLRALDRLRGMFAFAVWDDLEGTLFLARDRFGMKPLVWAEPREGTIIFASEPNACLASGVVSREIDPATDERFLRRGYLPSGASARRALRSLPPGHWLQWTRGRIRLEPYWSLAAIVDDGPARAGRVEEAAEALDRALADSVRAHLVSDVPVGIFLSGGLDSTAVLAAARRVSSGRLRTVTVACPGTPWDESAGARATAARFDTDHTEVVVTAERVFARLDRFFDAMEEPTADGLNTFVVAEAARDAGLRVILSGLGGDEVLGGYDSFVAVPRLLRIVQATTGTLGPRHVIARAVAHLPVRQASKLAEILAEAPGSLEEVWRRYRALFTRAQVEAILGHPLAADPIAEPGGAGQSLGAPGKAPERERESSAGSGGAPGFWRIARCEMEEFMIPQLLRDADQFTMTWGLELRTPFVDHELVCAMRRVGGWPRRRGASYKMSLFRSLPHLAPGADAAGPKRGFFLPLDRWLRDVLSTGRPRDEAFGALVADPRSRAITEAFLRGRLHWSRPWALYVLERWRQRHAARA